jgi:hypothetical protein
MQRQKSGERWGSDWLTYQTEKVFHESCRAALKDKWRDSYFED